MAQILLIRHCESTGQAPDAPLTRAGWGEAEALARRLAAHPIDRVVSSPYRRARETVEPLQRARGVPFDLDDRLVERRLADPPVDDWRAYVRASFEDPDSRALGGESGREVLARASAVIGETLASGARLPALATHGHWLALVLHSIDPGFGYEGWAALRNPDVFRLSGESLARCAFERL